jgi:AraC-like DNA-binding protein
MKKVTVPKQIQNDVRDIFIYQNRTAGGYSVLPFYADGYPGIVYIESKEATARLPDEKKLSPFFMYGQTVQPITLRLKKPYLLLVFRIEPLTGYQILNSDSSELINDCLDLTQILETNRASQIQDLQKADVEQKVATIADYISGITQLKDISLHPEIQKAVRIIFEKEGNVSIKNISDNLYISERTFQRQFQRAVGVTPKQLALIIRYHSSKKKGLFTASGSFFKAADDSYADQSHFIKQFKRYSGKTPVEYLNYINSINHQPLD